MLAMGELGDAILWHATLAARLGAPTEFRLLNAPMAGGAGGYQVIQCGVGDPDAEIAQVEEMLKTDPIGRTPLCAQIQQVFWQDERVMILCCCSLTRFPAALPHCPR